MDNKKFRHTKNPYLQSKGAFIFDEVLQMGIPPSAKILYGLLCTCKDFNKDGVAITRKAMAQFTNLSKQRITDLIKILKDNNLIEINGYETFGDGSKLRRIRSKPFKCPFGKQIGDDFNKFNVCFECPDRTFDHCAYAK